tara:strand:+ start:214 stop:651 length:438 start_codon:yes stop_codon:yes gene_type:complete
MAFKFKSIAPSLKMKLTLNNVLSVLTITVTVGGLIWHASAMNTRLETVETNLRTVKEDLSSDIKSVEARIVNQIQQSTEVIKDKIDNTASKEKVNNIESRIGDLEDDHENIKGEIKHTRETLIKKKILEPSPAPVQEYSEGRPNS